MTDPISRASPTMARCVREVSGQEAKEESQRQAAC